MEKLNLQFKDFFKKHRKGKLSMNPHKHWIYLLNSFFGLLFVLIVSSFYLLYEIKNDNFLNGSVDFSSKNTLISRNEKLLINVKNYFNSKSAKMESLKNDELKFSDPRFMK